MKPFQKRAASLFTIACLTFNLASAQVDIANKNSSLISSFKVSSNLFFNGGGFFGIGYGFAARGKHLQPALNVSLSARFGKSNLGNRDKYKTNWQLNTIISPLLTFGIGNKTGLYEEINPAYFGNVSGVQSNYQNAITLGTSFVTMPKGFGKNIETTRNRSQQLIYVQLKTGWQYHKSDSLKLDYGSFQFNIYEDFLFTDRPFLQFLADNFDRYFTGGGNIQVRVNQHLKFKVYNEVYTGANYRDDFDFPDWVDSLYVSNKINKAGNERSKRRARYAFQDFGQQAFNKARTFLVVDYTQNPSNLNLASYQFFIGRQREESMFSQNWIHSHINTIKKPLNELNKEGVLITKGNQLEKLHFFYPIKPKKSFLIGGGLQFQTYIK